MKQQHTSLLEYAIKDDIMSSQVHENTWNNIKSITIKAWNKSVYMRTQQNNIKSITWQQKDYCKTTGCNETTSPFSMHPDSPPFLLSHDELALAFAPSPPCTRQHAFFPPLLRTPFLLPHLSVSSRATPFPPHLTASYCADTSCPPPWSQCRSTAQNHIAGEGSTKNAIVTIIILHITHTWFHMRKK
jgi:hypothetical protein